MNGVILTLETRKQELENIFNSLAPISKFTGTTLKYNNNFEPVFTLPYNSNLNHAFGGIHGGIISYLLDSTAWFAVAIHFPSGTMMNTADLTVHFLKPVIQKKLKCIGKLIKKGKGTSVSRAELYDEENHLVAIATATIVSFGSDYKFENYQEKMIQINSKM